MEVTNTHRKWQILHHPSVRTFRRNETIALVKNDFRCFC